MERSSPPDQISSIPTGRQHPGVRLRILISAGLLGVLAAFVGFAFDWTITAHGEVTYEMPGDARQIRPADSFAGYMMFICRLLQDQPDEAALLLERMEAGRKDPSWHFAHAAQAYRKGDTVKGDYLVAAAERMWPTAETARYARPLADQGWRVDAP